MPFIVQSIYPEGEWPFHCCFMREDGVQFIASLDDLGALQRLHISISPVTYYRPELTKDEFEEYLYEVAPEVVQTFFGERRFARAPDDERRPQVKHYFAILEAHE